jgi:hypothetical protein
MALVLIRQMLARLSNVQAVAVQALRNMLKWYSSSQFDIMDHSLFFPKEETQQIGSKNENGSVFFELRKLAENLHTLLLMFPASLYWGYSLNSLRYCRHNYRGRNILDNSKDQPHFIRYAPPVLFQLTRHHSQMLTASCLCRPRPRARSPWRTILFYNSSRREILSRIICNWRRPKSST